MMNVFMNFKKNAWISSNLKSAAGKESEKEDTKCADQAIHEACFHAQGYRVFRRFNAGQNILVMLGVAALSFN